METFLKSILTDMIGEEDAYRKLIKTYLKKSFKDIAQLQDLYNKNDHDNMQLLLHSIKGSSSQIGGLKLHSSAAKLYELVSAKSIENLDPYFYDLLGEYKNLRERLYSELLK